MNKLEQAARQALEALERASAIMDSSAQQRQDDAITALREALAEQAEQEPVAKFLEDNLVVENERVGKSGHRVLEIREEELLRIMELYAAPVRTKDLTVSELDAIIEKHYDDEMDLKAMILDGIAADREKNK